MVYFGSRAGWSIATFAAINVALALAWLAFVALIGREHWRRSQEGEAALATEPHASGGGVGPVLSEASSKDDGLSLR